MDTLAILIQALRQAVDYRLFRRPGCYRGISCYMMSVSLSVRIFPEALAGHKAGHENAGRRILQAIVATNIDSVDGKWT
jgi:hypothetical protein